MLRLHKVDKWPVLCTLALRQSLFWSLIHKMLTSLFLVDMACVLMICIQQWCYEIRALCWYSRYVILRWRLQHKSACNKSDPLQNQTRNPYIVIHWSLLFICGYEILVICYLLYIILLSTILFIFFSFLFCFFTNDYTILFLTPDSHLCVFHFK